MTAPHQRSAPCVHKAIYTQSQCRQIPRPWNLGSVNNPGPCPFSEPSTGRSERPSDLPQTTPGTAEPGFKPHLPPGFLLLGGMEGNIFICQVRLPGVWAQTSASLIRGSDSDSWCVSTGSALQPLLTAPKGAGAGIISILQIGKLRPRDLSLARRGRAGIWPAVMTHRLSPNGPAARSPGSTWFSHRFPSLLRCQGLRKRWL